MPRFIYTPEFKAVFKKGATEKRFPLSKHFVAELVGEMILDEEKFGEREMIPDCFAKFDDYRMREAAAGLKGLSSFQAEELARDPAFKVRLRLSSNEDALSQLSSTVLIDLGRTDPEIAGNILSNMNDRPEREVKKITTVLSRAFNLREDIAEAALRARVFKVLEDDEAKDWALPERMPMADLFDKEWIKEENTGKNWLVYLSAGKGCYRFNSYEIDSIVTELSKSSDFRAFAPELLCPDGTTLAEAVESNVDTPEVVRIAIRSESWMRRLDVLRMKSSRMLTHYEIKEALEDDPSLIAEALNDCACRNKRLFKRLCRLYAEFPDRALQEELEESRRIAEDKDNDGGISPMAIFGNADSGSDLEDDSAEDDDDLIEVDNTENDWDWDDDEEEEEDDDWEEEEDGEDEENEEDEEKDEEDEEDGEDGEARSPGAEERPRSTVLRLGAGR